MIFIGTNILKLAIGYLRQAAKTLIKYVDTSPICTLYSLNTTKNLPFFAAKVPEIKNVQAEAYIAINRVNEMKHLNLSCEFQLTFQAKTQTRLLIDQKLPLKLI